MKKYKRTFSERNIGKCIFRSKNDIIQVLINYIKYVNLKSMGNTVNNEIQTILLIDKMSRLFIKNDKSIHSFQFPFRINKINGIYKVYCKDIEMDSITTSLIMSFFEAFKEQDSINDMYDCYIEVLHEYSINDTYIENIYWQVIFELLIFEPGYVRYDIDFSDRRDPIFHPEFHLDINYNNASTFKIGLPRKIDVDELIKVLDINEKCYFLA